MVENILVVVDEGDCGSPHIDKAIQLAEENEGTIHALYVVDAWRFGEYTVQGWDDILRDTHVQKSEDVFGHIEEKCDQTDVQMEETAETGKPLETILDYSRTNDIDAVVCRHPDGDGAKLHSPEMIKKIDKEGPHRLEVV